jgi:hypothetical protein
MAFAFMSRAALRSFTASVWAVVFFTAAPAWCAIATDVSISTSTPSQTSSITSPTFSTAYASELLLAFVAADGTSSGRTVTGISGAGLTWELVRRTNVQLGTAEIWRAFAPNRLSGVAVQATLSQNAGASITVVTLTGTDTLGGNGASAIGATASANANAGAPSASLVTTRNNSWVLGVGNDWDNALLRSVPADQTLVSQHLAAVGDTWWVQRLDGAVASAGTSVTINDTSPSTDRYNLTLVEVLAAPASGPTFAIAGAITPAAVGTGATMSLSQSGALISTARASTSSNYSFPSVPNGSYTVTPSMPGVSFSPAQATVIVSDAGTGAINFVRFPASPTDAVYNAGTGALQSK